MDTDRSNPPADENSSQPPALELSDAEVDALVSGLAPRVRKENERVNNELTRLAERAQVAASASGAAIALLSGDALVCRGRAGTTAPAQGARLDLASGLSGECARTGGIMLCDDTETDERVDVNSCRALGIGSILVAPLYDKGEVIGIFEVFSPERQAFGHEDIAVLQTMAEMAVAVLHPPGAPAAGAEPRAAGEAKPEIIAAAPPRTIPEENRPPDVSIDLSKLIIEDQPEATPEQPPAPLITFPPAAKKGAHTEEYAPFHDPDDDLVCELGPERIADLLEQPEIEDQGKPALKLFRSAHDEESKSPTISKKLLIAAGAVLLIAVVWLKFCNREQAAAPEGQTYEAPIVEPAGAQPPAEMPAASSAASKAMAKPVKPKRQSAPPKKHASPPVEPSGASIRPPRQETDAGASVSQFLETIRSVSGAGDQQRATPIVGSGNIVLPSPPEKVNGNAVQNQVPASSRSFRLAEAEATGVTDVSRRPSKTEELAVLQRAALGGDPEAELSLAVHYAYGDGVRQDYFEAVKWFTQAAAQGVTPTRGRAADALKRTNRWLAEHEKELAQNH